MQIVILLELITEHEDDKLCQFFLKHSNCCCTLQKNEKTTMILRALFVGPSSYTSSF